MPDRSVLLCYDGSDDAAHAIRDSAALFAHRVAIVFTVVQDTRAVPPLVWTVGSPGIEDMFARARDAGRTVADKGVHIAGEAGFSATRLVEESVGPVWQAIVVAAERRDVAVIVLGSRGLGGVKSALLGSVSTAVVHHATRPTLIVPHQWLYAGGAAGQ